MSEKTLFFPMVTGMLVGSVLAVKIIEQIDDESIFSLFIVALIFYILFKPAKLPAIVIPIKAFAILGVAYGDYMTLIILMSLGVIGGTLFGVKLLHAISEKVFQRLFRGVLFLVACQLLYKVFVVF